MPELVDAAVVGLPPRCGAGRISALVHGHDDRCSIGRLTAAASCFGHPSAFLRPDVVGLAGNPLGGTASCAPPISARPLVAPLAAAAAAMLRFRGGDLPAGRHSRHIAADDRRSRAQ